MSKKIRAALFFLLIGGAIGIAVYQHHRLLKNHRIIQGKVFEVKYTSKSPDSFVYFVFYINNKKIVASSSIPYTKWRDIIFLDSLLRGRELTVVYQKDNPDNCKMLFRKKSYEEFNLKIPINQQPIVRSIDSLIRVSL